MTPPGAPAPLAASAVPTRGEVLLGERFGVVIELRHHPGERYALSAAQRPEPFAIFGGRCAPRPGALAGETRCELELALLDLGTHEPVLRLDGQGPHGRGVVELRASPVSAARVSDPGLPASAIALRGMAEPVPLFVPTWEPVAWIALFTAVATAVAVAVVRRLGRRWRAAELRARAAPPPPPTPSEALEARLAALEGAPEGAEAWFALSQAVREYLAELSPRATLAGTTAEALRALRGAPVGGLDLDRYARFAAELDLAKYAGVAPDRARWRAALSAARDVLESTRPPRWDPGEEARRG